MKKQYKFTRLSSLLLVVVTVLAAITWSTAISRSHIAQAATKSTICPQGGKAPQIGCAGCSYCGGTGKLYNESNKSPMSGTNINYENGVGYQVSHTEETEYGVIEYRYRCENCGDTGYNCKRFDEFIGAYFISVNDLGRENQRVVGYCEIEGTATKSEGYVPIRWCSACGQSLYDAGDSWETVATWAQYHIEEEVNKQGYERIKNTAVTIKNDSAKSYNMTV